MKYLINIFIILFFVSSCSNFKIYRASIATSSNNTRFKTVKNNAEKTVCVEEVDENVEEPTKCSNGGFQEDKGLSYLEPSIELVPSYFSTTSFGYSYFFAINKSSTTLLDYPIEGEKSDIEIDRFSINPIVFYTFGDKVINNNKGASFRIGIGGALSYVYNFEIKRQESGEIFSEENNFKTGYAAFIEFSWKWLSFKVENSQAVYEGKKFENIKSDELKIENNKASLIFSYYL